MNFSPETLSKIESEFGSFIIDQVIGGSNANFFRFGYWKRVNESKLQEIVGNQVVIVEDDLDDDDCGTLYSYKFYTK